MPVPRCLFFGLGLLLIIGGGVMILCVGLPYQSAPMFIIGLFLGLTGIGLLVGGFYMSIKNLQVAVPGHFLLHPRTGTRFSPQQAISIQRRLDRIRREMSEDSVSPRPEPEPSLPSTPPPWTMEPPPSYDTVMKGTSNQSLGVADGTRGLLKNLHSELLNEEERRMSEELSPDATLMSVSC